MVTTDRHPGGERAVAASRQSRRQAKKTAWHPAPTAREDRERTGCGAWETMRRTGQEPLEAGRKSTDRRGREGRAGKKTPAGKGEPQKSQRKRREEKRRGWTKTTAATHSPEPGAEGRGRVGGGEHRRRRPSQRSRREERRNPPQQLPADRRREGTR